MTAAGTPFRCARASRQRGDPVAGSTPYGQGWLLIEHPGPWKIDAVAGADFQPSVLQTLIAAAESVTARILLIRRPGRSRRQAARAWAAVTPSGGAVWGSWRHDQDLLAAAAALVDPSEPVAVAEPILLVCAHGIHDTCCALRGRPVGTALAHRWPTLTWECSHVGGDRFAPNVVVLPDGAYYGNLDPASAVATVAGHFDGRIDPTYLRGMARLRPAAQAAVAALHQEQGPFGFGDVQVRTSAETSPGHWLVTLDLPGSAGVNVSVTAARRPPAQLTCRAGRETPATEYLVTRIDR